MRVAIYEFEGKRPYVGKGSFVHPEATIIGDVRIGEGCFVGAGARLRGDWGTIIIGPYSNIQENCVIHARPEMVAQLGSRNRIGHGAILHTPKLGDNVVVGIGAIILDNSVIGEGCCIGAAALVTEETTVPPNKLVVGVPAKVVKDISDEMRLRLDKGTRSYVELPSRCLKGLKISVAFE